MKPDAVEVGKRIREIRTDLGYSMSQFGKLVSDSPKTTVNNWERGINLPKGDKLNRIALLGKTTTNELLYGAPEEFIGKIGKKHFQLQFNPLIIQQIIDFLEQHKIDVYDEMTTIEFIQGIIDSGMLVEQESKYLSYTPIVGFDNLYLAMVSSDKEIEEPIFYVYVEPSKNCVHFLPYTFAEHQEELYYEWPALKKQVNIDYYTGQFSLLDVELKKSTIIYYGINKQKKELNIMEYIYNDSTKIFDKSQSVDETIVHNPFQIETEKMTAYLKLKPSKNR